MITILKTNKLIESNIKTKDFQTRTFHCMAVHVDVVFHELALIKKRKKLKKITDN